MKVNSFEDLLCWQKAMELCKLVYRLTSKATFNKDLELKSQMRRAAVSVPSNIAEGFERGTTKERIYYLYIAKGSTGELRTQMRIAFSLSYLDKSEHDGATQLSRETAKLIFGYIEYLKKTSISGDKHRKCIKT